jgi:hypothetical protein
MNQKFRRLALALCLMSATGLAFSNDVRKLRVLVSEINRGDGEQAVVAKLGAPAFKEFSDDVLVYSYCTGVNPALFVKVIFRNEKVSGLQQGTRELTGGHCTDAFEPMNFKN